MTAIIIYLLSILATSMLFAFGAVTTRFQVGKFHGATGRNITQDHQEIAYAANPAVTIWAQRTTLTIAQLTGNIEIDLVLDGCQPGDEINATFSADGTERTIVFGNNIIGNDLLAFASGSGGFTAVFNGTSFVVTGGLSSGTAA